jgi:hypothetical protein
MSNIQKADIGTDHSIGQKGLIAAVHCDYVLKPAHRGGSMPLQVGAEQAPTIRVRK